MINNNSEHKRLLKEYDGERHHSLGEIYKSNLLTNILDQYNQGRCLHKVHRTCLDANSQDSRACLVFKPAGFKKDASYEVDSFHILVADMEFDGSNQEINQILVDGELEPINWYSNGLVYVAN